MVSCSGRGTVGIDVDDGRLLWERSSSGSWNRTRAMNDTITYATDATEGLAVDARTGAVVWSRADLGPHGVNVAANQRDVFVSNDRSVVAYDRATGEQRWSHRGGASGLFATDDAVYPRTNDHRVEVLAAGDGHQLASSAPVSGPLGDSDVVGVTDHAVVTFRNNSSGATTVAFDRATGAFLWARGDEQGSYLFPVPGRTTVALADSDSGEVKVLDDRTGVERARYAGVPDDRNAAARGDRVFVVEDVDGVATLRVHELP